MTGDFQAIDVAAGSNGAIVEQSPLGGPVLQMTTDRGTALVALQGAQLIGWTPAGHDPVIWLSPVERLANPPDNPKPVRGGTPICWPWFANHPTDPSKPPHGFVRTRQWNIDRAERSATEMRVTFSIATTDADKTLWPGEASLQFTVTLGDELTMALTTRNMGPNAFSLAQALHTYFAVSDIANVTVEGFDGQTYMDKLDANARKQQAGPITFAAEVDRVYDTHEGAASITDRGLKRRIEISKSGSRSSVVWNPWIEKCDRLGDMGPDGYRGMVCVETCNAGADIVHISPKASHTISASYKIVRL